MARRSSRIISKCVKLVIIGILCYFILAYAAVLPAPTFIATSSSFLGRFTFGLGDEGGVCFAVSQKLKPHRYVTLTKWSGQLGNHMFQYAALLGVANHHGYVAYVTSTAPLLQYFDIPNATAVCQKPTNVETFHEDRCCSYDKSVTCLDSNRNYTLHGFLQSWRYFQLISGTIRNVFTLKDKYLSRAKLFIADASIPGRDNVCIHVRRGDFGKWREILRGYSQFNLKYIRNAMNYMRNATQSPQFIILSNDIQWCQDSIKGNDVIYSPFAKEGGIFDMALMSQCDHVITTTGTFGWWGAWLAGGKAVYYRGFPRPKSWLASQTDMYDYFPKGWVGVE